jgi:hypothetical protein
MPRMNGIASTPSYPCIPARRVHHWNETERFFSGEMVKKFSRFQKGPSNIFVELGSLSTFASKKAFMFPKKDLLGEGPGKRPRERNFERSAFSGLRMEPAHPPL